MSSEKEVYDAIVYDKAKKIRTEYITSETRKALSDLCEMYKAPFSLITEISKKENWDGERDAYNVSMINETRKQIEAIKTKANVNTLGRGLILQKKVFEKIIKDIDDGIYSPSIKDFAEISKILSATGETSESGIIGNNNKIIKITMQKPIEAMSYEELLELENNIKQEEEDNE